MAQRLASSHHDVVIVGGGAAGIAAGVAARRNGLDVVLIEAGPYVGGELISGLPIDGCLNARGEWIVGGLARKLFDDVARAGGFAQALCDFRQMWAVCVDPEMLKLAIMQATARAGVPLRLYTFAEDVIVNDGALRGIVAVSKGQRVLITGDVYIDCSGDGDIAALSGAPYELGSPSGELQPVSLIYRLANVDYAAYVKWVDENPDDFLLAENPVLGFSSKREAATAAVAAGYPFVALAAEGTVLGKAIENRNMYPCTALYLWPTAPARREVGLNTTRMSGIDGTSPESLSESLSTLTEQVTSCIDFCRSSVPGFSAAELAGIAPRIGIRETRRIVGDYALTEDDVVTGRKSDRGIAKGGHHIDIHGSGTAQVRRAIQDGRSYDIPYDCLTPQGLTNLLVAGRCFSSTREANGSARVMGPCMAMGEAAAVAAAQVIEKRHVDVRDVDVDVLRGRLRSQGAVLDGTH